MGGARLPRRPRPRRKRRGRLPERPPPRLNATFHRPCPGSGDNSPVESSTKQSRARRLRSPVCAATTASGPRWRASVSSCAAGETLLVLGPQRLREVDPAARARHPAAPDRRRGPGARLPPARRRLEAARPDRLPRSRPAAVSRSQRPGEPPLPGPPARTRGRRRRAADRGPAGSGRDGTPRRGPGGLALRRDAPAPRDMPLRPARAGAPAPRRARFQPRRRGAPAGAGSDRARGRAEPGSWSPTTPSGPSRTPTGPSSSATAGTR